MPKPTKLKYSWLLVLLSTANTIPLKEFGPVLEHHWNGSLLEEVDTVVQFASTMTWKKKHPLVKVVPKTYQIGVKLTKVATAVVESQLERLVGPGKWFVKPVRRTPKNEQFISCKSLSKP